jgi:hypothetical protein
MIAASDATAAEKANALASGGYVCDGTRDDVDLLAAIAKLPSGGLVQLSSGTFNVGNGPTTYSIISKNNITISGCGVTTILNMKGSIYDTAQNFTIENMQITGDGGDNSAGCGYISFYHSTTFNFSSAVKDILFTGTGTSATSCIMVYGEAGQTESYITIDNCTALNTSCRLTCFGDSDESTTSFSHVQILNSHAIGCGLNTRHSDYEVGFDLIEGIYPAGISDFLIQNCTAENCWESGFHAEGSPSESNISFVNCTAVKNGQKASPSWGAGFIAYTNMTFINCTVVTRFTDTPAVPRYGFWNLPVDNPYTVIVENPTYINCILDGMTYATNYSSSSNLLANGNFSQGFLPWKNAYLYGSLYPEYLPVVANITGGPGSNVVLKNQANEEAWVASEVIPVVQNVTYNLTYHSNVTSQGGANPGTLQCTVRFFNSSSGYINQVYLQIGITTPTNTWTTYNLSFGKNTSNTVPANASYMDILFYWNYASASPHSGDTIQEIQNVTLYISSNVDLSPKN